MEYIIKNIKTGKIEHYCSDGELPPDAVEVSDWDGVSGESNDLYDDEGNRYSAGVLIVKGLITDDRGDWWDKETKQKYTVNELNISAKSSWTKNEPIGFEPYIVFDSESCSWVEDPDLKSEYDNAVKIAAARAYLRDTDYKVIKSYEQGVTLDDIYEGETAAREACRDVIRSLTEES